MTAPPQSGNTSTVRPVRLRIKKCAISWLLLLTGLLPTLMTTVVCVFPPPVLPDINLKIYDYYLLSYRSPAGADAPLIVDIDARSLKEYGQWPWPRFRVAELMEKISQDAPLAVGVDIIFSEPDRTSLENIYEDIETHFDVRIKEDQGIPEHLRNNDAFLANALRQGKFVTSLLFTYGERASDDNCTLHPLNLTTKLTKNASEATDLFPPPDGTTCNLPILNDAVNMNGFLNVKEDPDGILRRVPMLIRYQGKLYPHLSLATLITALKPKTQLLKISKFGIEGLILDDRFIPLDPKGNFAVNFRGSLNDTASPPFEYISAADLLNDNVPSKKFKDKIVFLGTSAAGLNDIHHIPGDYVFPGVEFHANVVDNILSNTFLPHPHWVKGLEISIVFLSGLAIAYLFFQFGAKTGLLTFILSGIAFFWGAGQLFASYGIFISPLYPILTLALNFFLIYLIKFYRSDLIQRKRKKDISLMQEAMLETITMLTEARDQETGGHIRRTQGYIKIMAEELQKMEKYSKILSSEETEVICKVAPLHDVGKIGIPDSILLKPGRLSKEEFEEIKKHTLYGKQIIETALNRAGRNYFLEKALEIAYTHQEKWDGSGYPQGLSGVAIPLSGRIMAISDVYDALTSRRPYKTPVRHEKAVAIMKGDSGTHFDPDLIEVFMRVHERFRAIAIKYAESEQERALLSIGSDQEKESSVLSPAVLNLK